MRVPCARALLNSTSYPNPDLAPELQVCDELGREPAAVPTVLRFLNRALSGGGRGTGSVASAEEAMEAVDETAAAELEAAKGLSKMARKGIHTGEKIVDKVQGAQAKAIQAAKGLEGHVAAGANAMMRGDIQSVRGAVAGARAVVKDVNPLQRL